MLFDNNFPVEYNPSRVTLTSMATLFVPVDNTMRDIASSRTNQQGSLNGSILDGQGTFAGMLGEIAAVMAIPRLVIANSYDYDLMLDGLTIDVKTVDRTSRPTKDYMASVASWNTRQKTDFYLFVSTQRIMRQDENGNDNRDDKRPEDYTGVHIMGMMRKDDYFKAAKKFPAGTPDGKNNHVVEHTCYKAPYKIMMDFRDLSHMYSPEIGKIHRFD